MASGNIEVTIGFDKKSLRRLKRFAKKLQRCADTMASIKEDMDRLALKRMPKEGKPYVCDTSFLERETLYGQCGQFREAVIELAGLVAKKLRLLEICGWLERLLKKLQ